MWLGGPGDPLGIVQEIEVWPYEQMVYEQPRSCLGEWNAQIPLGVWDRKWSPNLGQMTRPSNNQQKRENLQNCRLCCSSGPQGKIGRKWKGGGDKYLNLAKELKKMWNMKVMVIPIVTGALGIVTKGISIRIGGLGNNGMGGDCPNYSIIEIGQNTEKSPGDLRRLAVTQTPVKDHQLMWKTLKE